MSRESTALDRIDHEILARLQNNARLSNKELAAEVGLAPSSCLARVQRLIRSGAVRGFHAEVDPKVMGVEMQALVFVRMARHQREAMQAFWDHLAALPEGIAVVVARQIEAPLSAWGLADLLVILDDGGAPASVAEALAMRVGQQLAGLHRACARKRKSSGADQRSVRRVLRAGLDVVALDRAGLEPVLAAVSELGTALAGLVDEAGDRQLRALRACLSRANLRYDPHSQRADLGGLLEVLQDPEAGLPGRWRRVLAAPVEALEAQTSKLILRHTHLPGRGVERGELLGLSMHLPVRAHSPIPAEPGPWTRVLTAIHGIDAPAPDDSEQVRAIERDMKPFRPLTRERQSRQRNPSQPWAAMHYLPGDNPEGEGLSKVMDTLESAGVVDGIHVSALLDRPRRAPGGGDDEHAHGHDGSLLLPNRPRESLGPVNSGSAACFSDYLERALRASPSHHASLVIAGTASLGGSFNVCHDATEGASLSTAAIAECLRKAIARSGRGPLALLIFTDPNMMSLEVAYELRGVAQVLATPTPEANLDYAGLLGTVRDALADDWLERNACEEVEGESLPERRSSWRGAVARRMASLLSQPEGSRLQILDLETAESLSRRLDMVCRILLNHLDDEQVWSSLAGIDWPKTPLTPLEEIVAAMRAALSKNECRLAEDAFAPLAKLLDEHGRSILIGAQAAPESGSLRFHGDIHFHALLAAVRLLKTHATQPHRLWHLISSGLAQSLAEPPSGRKREAARRLAGTLPPSFSAAAASPLITLSLENEDGSDRYELRLASTKSAALLLRQSSRINPATIEQTLAHFDYLLGRTRADARTWDYLQSLGASMGEDIISRLHDRLELEREGIRRERQRDDVHLALALPRKLLRFPWEMMMVPKGSTLTEKETLAERFAIGRQLVAERGRHNAPHQRDGVIRALIVGDPQRPGGSALAGARAEAEAIAKTFEKIKAELGAELDFERERDLFIGETVTRAAMRRLLRDGGYDIVHFAGHGSFSPDKPDRSAWMLSDGPLWAAELQNTLAWSPSPPWLIVSNACNTGMTNGGLPRSYQGEVYGFAEACIREGVRAVIAPLWKISDRAGRVLATNLYQSLLFSRATVGAALRQARLAARDVADVGDAGGRDISWAGMVLYGNPTDRLF
ncbi:MAG: CHAT domain-containing protein [Myxococcales bacterium]|nr:CHAT domain-containing protein [Myxococcales bacterium]